LPDVRAEQNGRRRSDTAESPSEWVAIALRFERARDATMKVNRRRA
jgi:hypothetical protein